MSQKKVKIADSLDDLITGKSDIDELNAVLSPDLLHPQENTNLPSELAVIPTSSVKNTNTPVKYVHERICPPAIKKISMNYHVFEDIIFLAKAINEISKERWGSEAQELEVYCYLLTDEQLLEHSQPAKVTEIFIPHHTASETAVDVSEESVFEVRRFLTENKKILLGWAHSHGHFDVFSSKTDEQNHLNLLHDTSNKILLQNFPVKYIYGITVVESGEHLGVILTHFPCGHIGREEDRSFQLVGVPYSHTEAQTRFQEIKTIVQERVTLEQPRFRKSESQTIKGLSEELLFEFMQKLKRVKYILFDTPPSDEESNVSPIELSETEFKHFRSLLNKYEELTLDAAEETFNTTIKKFLQAFRHSQNNM